MASLPAGSASGTASPSPGASSSSSPEAQAFRRSVWQATIPIAINFDLSQLPPGSDLSLDTYYTTAPRISYLPLLLKEVKRYFVDQVIEPNALKELNEKDFWFEFEGTPLKWHWPIGLLYDSCVSGLAYNASLSASNGRPSLAFGDEDSGHSRAGPSAYSNYPWRIKLHIRDAPMDKLHSSSSIDACKLSFMSRIKEADFIRNGSTKRVVNLRRQEQDALWEGVVEHDFEKFWSVAARLLPQPAVGTTTISAPGRISSRAPSLAGTIEDRLGASPRIGLTNLPNESQSSFAPSITSSAAASDSPNLQSGGPSAGSGGTRAIPMRFHLPDNAPIVQEPVSPTLEDGRPMTLHSCLSSLFPLLFPPPPAFRLSSLATPDLALPVIHGTVIPLDSEISWLASTYTSADGWLSVLLVISP